MLNFLKNLLYPTIKFNKHIKLSHDISQIYLLSIVKIIHGYIPLIYFINNINYYFTFKLEIWVLYMNINSNEKIKTQLIYHWT
jgi:hypothetical protein